MKRPICFGMVVALTLGGLNPLSMHATPHDMVSSLSGQQDEKVTITGKVQDVHGEPLIGVRIQEQGSSTGTITDMDGNFSLRISKLGVTIDVSYIGFTSQSLVVNTAVVPTIVLKEESTALDEVVVTALGIKRQTKALSYNVQELKGDELTTAKDANFVNGLNGKVAGVTINQSSGGVGGAARIVMRGTKSIEKSNNALYVIDGVPIFPTTSTQGSGQFSSSGSTESAADINPDDIESISILTGASAAALYGSAAANGAILITTKKGKAGKVRVSYSFNGESGSPLRLPEFQSRYGSDGLVTSWGSPIPDGAPVWNVEDFFQRSTNMVHSVSVSGGTDRNQTYLSFSSTDAKGLVPNNKYDRYNFNARNTSSLMDNRLTIDVQAGYIHQYHRNMINQGQYMNPMVSAYLMPRSDDNEKVKAFERYDSSRKLYVQNWTYGDANFNMQNPYWIAYRNLREMNRERYILSLNTSFDVYKWSDHEKLALSARVRSDVTHFTGEDKRYASTSPTHDVSEYGYYGMDKGADRQTYADVMSTLNKEFDVQGQRLSLNAMLGASIQDTRYDNQTVKGPLKLKGVPNLFNIFNIDHTHNGTVLIPEGWIEQTQSIFGSAELGLNSYLYLTLTGRNDWASQLANSPQLSFFYPSVGISGVITEMMSEETRIAMRPYLSYLKARFAYSSVGSPFQRGLTSPTYILDEQSHGFANITNFPVGELFPERTDSYEIGLSARAFNGMLTLDGSLYCTYTKNQTIGSKAPSSSGYDKIYIQTGNVRNQGVELALGLNFGEDDGVHYNTNFTFGYNHNEILSLAENYVNPLTGENESQPYLERFSLGSLKYILKTGGSLGDIYTTTDFKRNPAGDILVDESGNVSKQEFSEMRKLGSVLPDCNYGWRHELGYKGLSIGALLTARQGGLVVSLTQAAMDQMGVSEESALARDRGGVIEGNSLIDPQSYFHTRGSERMAQYYTYSATNIRLQEASISYRIPKQWLKGYADITLSAIGRNLGFLYCKAPFDPESVSSTDNYGQGLDYFMLPTQKSWGFSVKLAF